MNIAPESAGEDIRQLLQRCALPTADIAAGFPAQFFGIRSEAMLIASIDASYCKVHPHAAGARGGNQAMSCSKEGSTPRYIWPWMRMACWSEWLLQTVPVRIAHRLAP
jgi:hypothetical protein